jgi:hypothetical protein
MHGLLLLFLSILAATTAPPLRAADPAENRDLLNQQLPHWLSLGAAARFRAEGQHGVGFESGRNQDYLLERYRFDATIAPLHWLQFFGQVQDARAAWMPRQDGGVRDTFDLRQAYVHLGSEAGWIEAKVGRQTMFFGSERVIGAGEWGNTARVFDAARLILHHNANRVDVFSSSVVANDADHWDHHQQGNNLHGVYASLGSPLPGSRVEPYLLFRTSPRILDELGQAGRYRSWTFGLRMAGKATSTLSYEVETIGQRGTVAGSHLSAWASTAQVQRQFRGLRWKPVLLGEWNYASGDHRRGDGVAGTFEQLYPTNHGIYGIADQIGRRNTINVRTGWWMRPASRLTLKTEAHYFWLADPHDALYAFNGAVSVPAVTTGAISREVGPEIDIIGDFHLSRHYDIGAQYGHLFPGEFLRTYSPGGGRGFYAVFLDLHL